MLLMKFMQWSTFTRENTVHFCDIFTLGGRRIGHHLREGERPPLRQEVRRQQTAVPRLLQKEVSQHL